MKLTGAIIFSLPHNIAVRNNVRQTVPLPDGFSVGQFGVLDGSISTWKLTQGSILTLGFFNIFINEEIEGMLLNLQMTQNGGGRVC